MASATLPLRSAGSKYGTNNHVLGGGTNRRPWQTEDAHPWTHQGSPNRISSNECANDGLLFILPRLVLRYQVLQNALTSETLALGSEQDENSVFFIKVSANTLITIAFWSSMAVSILVGFAVTLICCFVAS